MEGFTWIGSITVAKCWVEDGFELTEQRLKEMILSDLTFATSDEVEVKILKAPSKKAIRKVQGYKEEK